MIQVEIRKLLKIALPFVLALVALFLVLLFFIASCSPKLVPRPKPTPIPTVVPKPVCVSPLIPYGQLPTGTKYSTIANQKNMPTLTWMGIVYVKQPGVGGRLWGEAIPGAQILLYGPASQYCPARK